MQNDFLINRIKEVYNALEELGNKVVFVGGAVLGLYAQREILELRPTEDIDIIIEILNYKEQAALDEKLRQKGFTHDQESGIACRYKIKEITVDIMPTVDRSFGFDSSWYKSGFRQAISYKIDDAHVIRILPAPYYLATKFEAFHDRGEGDGRTSKDFEDIVFLLENRSTIWNEIMTSDNDLKDFLVQELNQLLSEQQITEWIFSHASRASGEEYGNILNAMNNFVNKFRD